MAFLFGESFEKTTSRTELERFYFVDTGTSSTLTIDATHGRWGTACMKCATTLAGSTLVNAWIQRYATNVSGNTHISHFSFETNEVPGASGNAGWGIWSVVDVGFTATQCWLKVNVDMTISVYRGTTLLQTSTRTLQVARQHWIEVKAVVNTGTSGSIDVRVDGETSGWISTGGTNTANAGVAGWGAARLGFNMGNQLGQARTNTLVIYFDDWVVLDGSGGVDDDWKGEMWVTRRKPTAETSGEQDFTPSTGTDNSALVDDDDPNSDTDEVHSSTVNHRDLYVLQDVTATTPTILFYQGYVVMKKAAAGIASVALLMQQSGTEYAETGQNPGTGYTGHFFPVRLNPATSALLTYSEANANDWGIIKTG